jgi:hypothetical protein
LNSSALTARLKPRLQDDEPKQAQQNKLKIKNKIQNQKLRLFEPRGGRGRPPLHVQIPHLQIHLL